jgi:hypothetical protein
MIHMFQVILGKMTLWVLIGFVFFWIPSKAFPLTFQFDRNQPGVRDVVSVYAHFPLKRGDLTSYLPPVFYIVTSRSEKDILLAAEVGDISKQRGLASTLSDMTGKQKRKLKGPHGETIVYDPNAAGKNLSAYAVWGGWLFVGRTRDSLTALSSRFRTPQAVVTPDRIFQSDGLIPSAGIRYWGENSGGELTALLKENQKKILIPIIRDPSQVGRISGMFQAGPGRKLNGYMTLIPSLPKHQASLRGDVQFVHESARRRLAALGVLYEGTLSESGSNITLKISIGDYIKARSGLIKIPL